MPSLPKILCLHGLGSSGNIFQSQMLKICQAFRNEFDFVFPDAPFPSLAGPGMYPVYHESGPFFRWQLDHVSAEDWDVTEDDIRSERQIVRQFLMDRLTGTSDDEPFVGILGFSQGARLATGIALSLLNADSGWKLPHLKFIILFSATYPALLLEHETKAPMQYGIERRKSISATHELKGSEKIRIASLHLLGSRDPWRSESGKVREQFYDEETSGIITFTGGHQVPTQNRDVVNLVQAIQELSRNG